MIVDTTEEHVRSIVDVNLLGVWHSMSEEIGAMLTAGAPGPTAAPASARPSG